jgi:uncharacterized alpha-E superfamily protein
VVSFLLFDHQFPRSVAGCLERIKSSLSRLPNADRTLPAAASIEQLLAGLRTDAHDGAELDSAMDQVQVALEALNNVVFDAFVRAAE